METDSAWALDQSAYDRTFAVAGPGVSRGGPNGVPVAHSAAMRQVLLLARRAAHSEAPVLIQGELGVGKATIAGEIHRQSGRTAGRLVRMACAALRDSNEADRLFRECLEVGSADHSGPPDPSVGPCSGTLLLDDVSQLPMWAQARLLELLRRRQGHRRGSGEKILSVPRVIALSTGDLVAAVSQDKFHAALYYIFSAFPIHVSPLRHRQEDIRPLGEYFLKCVDRAEASRTGQAPRRFSDEAWRVLLSYDWPGNVLQLASVVERAAMLADGEEIGALAVAECLPPRPPSAESEGILIPFLGGLRQMELAIVDEVVRRCGGNKAAAARTLRLHRRTLYRLLENRGRPDP